jgi:CheY-like chemotaxis protein
MVSTFKLGIMASPLSLWLWQVLPQQRKPMMTNNETLDPRSNPLNLCQTRKLTRTILVVDDNESVAKLIVTTLRRLGHGNVKVARNGKEALEIAERIRPDVVILDIDMPEMDGIETARCLRLLSPCSIIFSTGSCDGRTVRRTREMPASSYLVKPFSPAQLEAAVRLAD